MRPTDVPDQGKIICISTYNVKLDENYVKAGSVAVLFYTLFCITANILFVFAAVKRKLQLGLVTLIHRDQQIVAKTLVHLITLEYLIRSILTA